MARIYHNPRCSKSRAALALMNEHGIEPEVVLYLQTPPGTEELRGLLQKLGLGIRDIIRKGESAYRDLRLNDDKKTDDELIFAVSTHPVLLERPIAVNKDKAVIGRPPENVLRIFNDANRKI